MIIKLKNELQCIVYINQSLRLIELELLSKHTYFTCLKHCTDV